MKSCLCHSGLHRLGCSPLGVNDSQIFSWGILPSGMMVGLKMVLEVACWPLGFYFIPILPSLRWVLALHDTKCTGNDATYERLVLIMDWIGQPKECPAKWISAPYIWMICHTINLQSGWKGKAVWVLHTMRLPPLLWGIPRRCGIILRMRWWCHWSWLVQSRVFFGLVFFGLTCLHLLLGSLLWRGCSIIWVRSDLNVVITVLGRVCKGGWEIFNPRGVRLSMDMTIILSAFVCTWGWLAVMLWSENQA